MRQIERRIRGRTKNNIIEWSNNTILFRVQITIRKTKPMFLIDLILQLLTEKHYYESQGALTWSSFDIISPFLYGKLWNVLQFPFTRFIRHNIRFIINKIYKYYQKI